MVLSLHSHCSITQESVVPYFFPADFVGLRRPSFTCQCLGYSGFYLYARSLTPHTSYSQPPASLRRGPYGVHNVPATPHVFTSFFFFFFFLISLSRFFSNRATTPLLTLLTRDTLTTCCLPLWSLVNRRTPTCESEISPGKGLRSLLGGLPWPRSSLISFSPAGVIRYVEIRLEGPK